MITRLSAAEVSNGSRDSRVDGLVSERKQH